MTQSYAIASNHGEWLALRSKGIGGSDVGSVLGYNAPWCSPYQIWLEKTGQYQPPDISDKVAVQIGNELEDLVARMFTQETGLKVQKDNKTYFHKEHPFLLANIDRKIIGKRALLECKTTSTHNRHEWKDDEVPPSYLLQVQHYLNVLDYDKAYIAVIIGNSEFVWKEIKRDEALINLMTERLVEFWQINVLQGVAPAIDGSIQTKQALSEIYDNLSDIEYPMSRQQIEITESLVQMTEDAKLLDKMIEEKKNQLRAFMGENDTQSLVSDQYKVTWKDTTRTTLDTKRLKADYPEIYEQYSKQSTTKRFNVKEL